MGRQLFSFILMMNFKPLIVKFLKFGVVGFSGVIIDYGITYLSKEILKIHKYISNSLGFICAATSNYFLNRVWTFKSHDPEIFIQFTKFIVISIIGLGINNLVIYFLNDKKNMNFYLAKFFAIGVVTVWNFFMNYIYTFV